MTIVKLKILGQISVESNKRQTKKRRLNGVAAVEAELILPWISKNKTKIM